MSVANGGRAPPWFTIEKDLVSVTLFKGFPSKVHLRACRCAGFEIPGNYSSYDSL